MNKKEFKERVLGLFSKYKDKPLGGAERFNNEIYLKYGFIPTSDLYRKIINYQIQKYGRTIEDGREILKPTVVQCQQTKKHRVNVHKNQDAYYKQSAIEKRAETRIKRELKK